MDYAYGGPLGSSVNGFAAFLSGAVSYFMPISLTGVVVEPAFINELCRLDKITAFLETYGSISLNIRHFQSLDEKVQRALKILIDKGLVKILDLSREGTEFYEMLGTRLSEEEALSLAQALDSGVNRVVVESEEAKSMAVELGIRPLSYEEFLLEAYKQGLVKSSEILKIL